MTLILEHVFSCCQTWRTGCAGAQVRRRLTCQPLPLGLVGEHGKRGAVRAARHTAFVFDDLPPNPEVFILGAGFSRALSAWMPLTDELGNACLALNELHGAHGVPAEFTGGRFETWLSSIAEPQPYLPEPSNLENQVLFVKFSDAIGKVLGLRMNEVLSGPPPTWHVKFITAAHVRRATVITFNYDTLVECAVDYRGIWLPGLPEPVGWTEVTGNVPGWPAGASRLGASPVETFRLLKLHGSLNWFWTPGDVTGLSVARRQLPGTFNAPQPYTEADRRRQLPARVPFVVPPSATKSSYYQNRLVRELWIQAGEALESASHVSLVGYSLPLTDLTVSNMLNRALGGSDVIVHVVDLDPEPIVVRLGALGVAACSEPGSPSATEDYVTSYCQAIGRELVADLRESLVAFADQPILIAWGVEQFSVVVGFRATESAVLLTVEPAQVLSLATARRPLPLPTLREVLAATPVDGHLLAEVPDGPTTELLARVETGTDYGYGAGRWNVMLPSTGYPE